LKFRLHTIHKDNGETKVFEVDASDEQSARALARKSSYLVQSVQPMTGNCTRPAATTISDKHSGSVWGPLTISLSALCISLAALAWSIFANPFGSALKQYDLSTPEASLKSLLMMQASGDYQAILELNSLGENTQEKIDSLKIHKKSEDAGRIVLFISYEDNGISKYEVSCLEKKADSDIWMLDGASYYSIYDDDLKEAAKAWETKSGTIESDS
jgi:hypothetical protein